MKIGVYYSQTEIGIDPHTVAAFARTVESVGFDYLVLCDHVIATDLSESPELAGRYSPGDPIGEVFVTLAYIAASTRTLGLVTGVLICPQRQTVLVAKQSSVLDVLPRKSRSSRATAEKAGLRFLHDRTIEPLAASVSKTMMTLAMVKGIGPAKLEAYDEELLAL